MLSIPDRPDHDIAAARADVAARLCDLTETGDRLRAKRAGFPDLLAAGADWLAARRRLNALLAMERAAVLLGDDDREDEADDDAAWWADAGWAA